MITSECQHRKVGHSGSCHGKVATMNVYTQTVKLVLKKSRSKFWLCDSTGSSSPLERLSYYGANVEKIGDKVKHTDLADYPSYLEAHPIMPLA